MFDETIVTYPGGTLENEATVLALVPHEDRVAIITDITPFHPVDHKWPDHPADTGIIIAADGTEFAVIDCITAAQEAEGELLWDRDIPAPRGAEGWRFYAMHMVEDAGSLAVGDKITLKVDPARSAKLRAAHSACHLAALALNEGVKDLWRKEVRLDARGAPDFDQLAISISKITETGSYDAYRLGKSLRKKGFTSADFWPAIAEIEARVNGILADWVAAGGAIEMKPAQGPLTARREWHASVGGVDSLFPCGGAHLENLDQLASVTIALEADEAAGTLEMYTTATTK